MCINLSKVVQNRVKRKVEHHEYLLTVTNKTLLRRKYEKELKVYRRALNNDLLACELFAKDTFPIFKRELKRHKVIKRLN